MDQVVHRERVVSEFHLISDGTNMLFSHAEFSPHENVTSWNAQKSLQIQMENLRNLISTRKDE